MAEYTPTQDDRRNLETALFWLGSGMRPSVVLCTGSQRGADWVDAQMAELGYGGRIQYVVTRPEVAANG